jgi:putative Mg2+ transporter-C (MgtC) family protein
MEAAIGRGAYGPRMPTNGELSLRLLLAAALAGLLGAERELTDQPAGMRTHMLLGVGAALFAIISAYGFQTVVGEARNPAGVHVDVSRVAAQIASGVGFIGGGAILKYGASIRGLTTAASLWATAAIGTAVGTGLALVSTVTTLIVLVALVGLRPVREQLRRHALPRQEVVIVLDRDGDLTAVLDELRAVGVAQPSVRVERGDDERTLRVTARLARKEHAAASVAHALARHRGVRDVDWS